MTADLAQPLAALTQSIRELTQSIAAKGPERMTAYSTAILAFITFILAVAAVWSARYARRAAEASRDMVAIERERQREADRPEVMVTPKSWRNGHVEVGLYSVGAGPVRNIECYCAYEVDGKLIPCKGVGCEPIPNLPGRGDSSVKPARKIMFSVPQEGKNKEIIICHYTGRLGSPQEEGGYHYSLFDKSIGGDQRSTYRAGEKLPDRYKLIYKACQSS